MFALGCASTPPKPVAAPSHPQVREPSEPRRPQFELDDEGFLEIAGTRRVVIPALAAQLETPLGWTGITSEQRVRNLRHFQPTTPEGAEWLATVGEIVYRNDVVTVTKVPPSEAASDRIIPTITIETRPESSHVLPFEECEQTVHQVRQALSESTLHANRERSVAGRAARECAFTFSMTTQHGAVPILVHMYLFRTARGFVAITYSRDESEIETTVLDDMLASIRPLE